MTKIQNYGEPEINLLRLITSMGPKNSDKAKQM